MKCFRGTIVVGIACALFFITGANALRCFQCDSTDPGCANLSETDVSSPYFRDCTSKHANPFCRKTIQTILDSNKLVRITRSCGWILKRNETNCYRDGDTDFKFDRTCQCFTDGCNSAPSRYSSMLPLIILFTFVPAFINRLF